MFPTARTLSVHLSRSPACEAFANERDRKRKARKVALMNAAFVVQSSKRPALLRRDVVNDITHITQNEPDREVVLKDWSDFNFADMYGDEMEVYEQDVDTESVHLDDDDVSVMSDDTDNIQFVPPPNDIPLMFTTDQKWTIALLKLLDDMNAPDYAFKAIIKWARAAKDDNYSFFPKGGLSRSKNVDILFQSMTNATQLLPAIQPVSEANVSQCELQAAQRLAYSIMIDTVYSRLWDSADNHSDINANKAVETDNNSPSTGRATFATVVRNEHPHVSWSKRVTVKWDTDTDTTKMDPPRALSEFLLMTFGNPVRFCTECRMGKNIFRCHPDFQSDGALFDWMRAEFHGRVYPCRLSAVVVIHDDAINTDRLELVVQRATQTTGINSVLLTEWLWSSEYHVILPSDVKSPCFVVSIKEDLSKILETLPIEDWHNAF